MTHGTWPLPLFTTQNVTPVQIFSTIYTLTKNRSLESAPRLAVLRVVLEWLQLFLVLFNSTFPWHIVSNSGIWQAIQWLLVRNIVQPKGYAMYISVFYIISALILATILMTVWVAVVLKGDDASNVWMRRLISALQLFAMVIYSIMWPAVLDYLVFLFDCRWSNLPQGRPPYHVSFADHSKLAPRRVVAGSPFCIQTDNHAEQLTHSMEEGSMSAC